MRDLPSHRLRDLLGEASGRRALGRAAVGLAAALAAAPGRLPGAPARLPGLARRLPGAAERLPGTAGCLAGGLARLPERLAGCADHLVEVADSLPGALADIANGLPGPLADVADRLARAGADVLQRRLRARTDLLGGVPGLVHGLTGALADLRDRSAESLHQLRVAIERRHQAIHDGGDVIEAGLEHHLRVDALDVELDPAEVEVHSDVQLDQVEHPRLERHVSVEVLELEVNEVDLELGHVEEHVRRTRPVLLLAALVGPVLAIGVGVGPHRLHRRALSAGVVSAPVRVPAGPAARARLALLRLLSHHCPPWPRLPTPC